MKRIITALIVLIAAVTAMAQLPSLKGQKGAATWTSKVEMTGKKTGRVVLTLTPAAGWHIYGFEVGEGGPKAMNADFAKSTGVKFKGSWKPSVAPVKKFDDIFGIEVTYWTGKVELSREFDVTDAANAKITGTVTYQSCNGETCNPPQKYNVALTLPAKSAGNK
ncbi:MAG: hypothetical protein HDS69_07835 [Bacteroidales bacterium]|nr:hypothetical protein [Bacteroidales bacterium]MBD5247460.1 hypothetical protein [Barnesiella sp.]